MFPFQSLLFPAIPRVASDLELSVFQAVYSERLADSRGLGNQTRYLIINRQAVANEDNGELDITAPRLKPTVHCYLAGWPNFHIATENSNTYFSGKRFCKVIC